MNEVSEEGNIVLNPSFEDGLNNWSGRGCRIVLHDAIDGKIFPKSGKYFAAATGRTQTWNGIQQELTQRVKRKLAYQVTALVRIYSKNVASSNVGVTLYVQTPDLREQYIVIGRSVCGSFYEMKLDLLIYYINSLNRLHMVPTSWGLVLIIIV